jgi:predicted RNA-binding protein with PUA-like domain
MQYWLMKSEPDVFGIDDLAKAPRRTTGWDGVRNYQARNFMRDGMARGDQAFFYHSNCAEPGIAGIVEITRTGYPDHTAFDRKDPHYDPASTSEEPRWYMVDVTLVRRMRRVITLAELRKKAEKELKGLALLRRGNRLSILPVSEKQWRVIVAME